MQLKIYLRKGIHYENFTQMSFSADGYDFSPQLDSARLRSVAVSEQKNLTLTVGKSAQLKLNNARKKVTWSCAPASVAKINSAGKVTAKKAGKATVTAKSGGKKYICKVTVNNANSKARNVSFRNPTGGSFIKGVPAPKPVLR